MSSLYAAASGTNPAPSEFKKSHIKSSPCANAWLPQQLGKYDRSITIKKNDAMDGLMDQLPRRNRDLVDTAFPASNATARATTEDNQDIYITRPRLLGPPTSRLRGPGVVPPSSAYRR